MIIKILYESKYSLATVKNGENVLTGMATITENPNKDVKNIFKKENGFLDNIKELNKYYPNYQYADITQNTVLGILCRLIGEVRRLDSLDSHHPILAINNKISFENKNTSFQNEIILLHTPLKEVQNNAGGILPISKPDHFLLTKNNLSKTLLSVFDIKDQNELINLLKGMNTNDKSFFYNEYEDEIKANTFIIKHTLFGEKQSEIFNGLYFLENGNLLKEINNRLFYGKKIDVESLDEYVKLNIEDENFKLKDISEKRKSLGVNEIFNLGGFLFAKKIVFLKRNNLFVKDFLNSLNREGNSIKGLAPDSGTLTIKDFYTNFVTDKKMSWSMPYSVEVKQDLFVKGDLDSHEFNSGVKLGVTKECGELIITLDLSLEDEINFYKRIESAGVNTFHLGKKGLAYIDTITLEKS